MSKCIDLQRYAVYNYNSWLSTMQYLYCNKKWNTKPAVYYIPLLVHRLEPKKLSIILAHKTTSSTVKASCLLAVVPAYKIVGMS